MQFPRAAPCIHAFAAEAFVLHSSAAPCHVFSVSFLTFQARASATPPPAATAAPASTTATPSCAAARRAGGAAPATQVRTPATKKNPVNWSLLRFNGRKLNKDFLLLQPRTARATRGPVRTEGRAWEEATSSPASARTAGKDPRARRVGRRRRRERGRGGGWGTSAVMDSHSLFSSCARVSHADVDDCNPHPW